MSLYEAPVLAVWVFNYMDGLVGVSQTLEILFLCAFLLKEMYMHVRDGLRIPSSIHALFGIVVRYWDPQ